MKTKLAVVVSLAAISVASFNYAGSDVIPKDLRDAVADTAASQLGDYSDMAVPEPKAKEAVSLGTGIACQLKKMDGWMHAETLDSVLVFAGNATRRDVNGIEGLEYEVAFKGDVNTGTIDRIVLRFLKTEGNPDSPSSTIAMARAGYNSKGLDLQAPSLGVMVTCPGPK